MKEKDIVSKGANLLRKEEKEVLIPKKRIKIGLKQNFLIVLSVIMYFFSYFSVGFQQAITGPTKMELAKFLNVSDDFVSTVFLTKGIGGIIGFFLGSFIYQIRNSSISYINLILIFSLVINSLCLFLISLVPNIYFCLFIHLIEGIEISLTVQGCILGILFLFSENYQSALLQAINSCFGMGGIITFIISIIDKNSVDTFSNLKIVYFTSGSLLLLPVLPLIIITIIQFLSKIKTVEHKEIKKQDNKEKKKEKISFLMQYFVVFGLSLFITSISFIESSFYSLISTYIINKDLASHSIANLIGSCFWIGYTISRIISTFITLKMKPYYLIVFCLVGLIYSFSIFIPNLFNSNLKMVWIFSVFIGVFISPISPSNFSIVQLFQFQLNSFQTGCILFFSSFGLFSPMVVNYSMNNSWWENESLIYLNLFFLILATIIYFSLLSTGILLKKKQEKIEK